MRIARRLAVFMLLAGFVVLTRGRILAAIGVIALSFLLLMTFVTLLEYMRDRAKARKAGRLVIHAHFTSSGQIVTISLNNVVRIVDPKTGRLVDSFRRDIVT